MHIKKLPIILVVMASCLMSAYGHTALAADQEKGTKPIIYDIVGDSQKLNEKGRKALSKWRKEIVELAKNNPDFIFINGPTDKKLVALTFDDGPDNVITPKVLDILKQNHIHASFFFIGDRISAYKDVVKRADKEGNLILSHSFSHPNLTHLSPADVNKQIQDTEKVIYQVINKKPTIIRPPYGAIDNKALEQVKDNQLKIVIWSIDTLDWKQKESANIVKNVVSNIRPGDIILMHSNQDKLATLQALPTIIKELTKKGYKFVDLAQLLNLRPYK